MPECIERQTLIGLIKELPLSDVVKVVRCRDCKFGVCRDWQAYPVIECRRPDFGYGGLREFTDFCSYGEARE